MTNQNGREPLKVTIRYGCGHNARGQVNGDGVSVDGVCLACSVGDLALLDDLLVLMKGADKTWWEFESEYHATRAAMQRLRQAWRAGVLDHLTASLADYFSRTEDANG